MTQWIADYEMILLLGDPNAISCGVITRLHATDGFMINDVGQTW